MSVVERQTQAEPKAPEEIKVGMAANAIEKTTSDSMSAEERQAQADLKVFERITVGMDMSAVERITRDFKVNQIGSGFAIDSYTLSDKSEIRIWYNSGRVMCVKHGDTTLAGE